MNNCEFCNIKYTPKHKKSRFCSIKCSSSRKRKELEYKDCEVCGENFVLQYENKRFCSSKCWGIFQEKEKLPKQKCVICDKLYTPYRPSSIYCSRSCQVTGINIESKKPLVTKTCEWCQKDFTVPFITRKQRFCDRSCATSYNMSVVDKEEFGKKISEVRLANIASGKTAIIGTPHSEETKIHLSKLAKERFKNPTNNGMFGRNHTESSKDSMSKTKAARMSAGLYDKSKYGKSGYLITEKAGSIFFRSSWEKKAFELLDEDKTVKCFEVEPFYIPYYRKEGDRSNKRNYVPDILITYHDDTIKLVEVKPKCYVDSAINIAKFEAARKFCDGKGWIFEVWTQDDIFVESS